MLKRWILISVMIVVATFSCFATSNIPQGDTKVVKVYYFHGSQRCATCQAVEKETKALLQNYFSKELQNGKIHFKVVDISQKENKKLVEKYEVTWSSLIIDDGKTVVDFTNDAFRYARNEPKTFETKLFEIINNRLK